jgi:hypothetical protein
MRDRIAATGTSPDALEVVANLRVRTSDNGVLDLDATLAPVPALVAAGATDLRVRFPAFAPGVDAEPALREFVTAFRSVTG